MPRFEASINLRVYLL